MQKYIYRNVILLTMVTIAAYAGKAPMNLDINITNFQNKNKELINKIQNTYMQSAQKYGSDILGDHNIFKNIKNKKDTNSTRNTIFYFYSETMPVSAIGNILPQIKKYKEYRQNSQFFIVLNGFPKKDFFQKLRKLYKPEYQDLFAVKIHPFIYQYYKLKMVPAFALTRCDTGDKFRFKKCQSENSFLAKGDISLRDFFEILSEQDEHFKDTYNYLTEAK